MSVAQLDHQFPGGKISARPIQGMEIASVRRGASPVTSIPWMLPDNAHMTASRKRVNDALFDRKVPEDAQALRDKIMASLSDNRVAAELAAYREFEIRRDVLAVPFAFGLYQSINLSDDELPLIRRPQTNQYFNVRYKSQDGGYRGDQWRTTTQVEQILMETIGTDAVEYPLNDIQLGNLNEFDRVNKRLSYDLEMKIDTLAKEALDDAKTTSGLRDLLALHPQIIPANIPDTNYLDLTSTGTYGPAHKLTINRIKAILAHIARFGVGIDPDVPQGLGIQSMQISPQNISDVWDYIDLTAGYNLSGATVNPADTVPEEVRSAIFSSGVFNSAWGYSWATVPNARLDTGRLYVLTNQPIGWMFTKTQFDKTIRWDGPDWQLKGINAIAMQRVLKFVTVDEWKYRVVIVDF